MNCKKDDSTGNFPKQEVAYVIVFQMIASDHHWTAWVHLIILHWSHLDPQLSLNLQSMSVNLSKLQEIVKDKAWGAAAHGVTNSWTRLSN